MIDPLSTFPPRCTSLLDAADGPTRALHLIDAGAEPPPGAAAADFSGQAGRLFLDAEGAAWFGLGETRGDVAPSARAMAVRALPSRLPPGDWRVESDAGLPAADLALAWALGARSYRAFKTEPAPAAARLVVAPAVLEAVRPVAEASALACDLVDAPANALGPAEIEAAVRRVAERRGARVEAVVGEDLLTGGYPAVHAVGRAAAPHRAPRLVELDWEGSGAGEGAPVLALVGKGVAFDTGGLDLKPSSGMRWMKKDMGGAAHALALADLVMARDLPVRLRLLIPAVENAVAGDAMRPGDVLETRAGKTVEVGNTDAEGRLILADALTRAGELAPDLTIDLATLTGAARVALGPQVVPVYTADAALAAELAQAAELTADPLWRMPLWDAYDEALASDVADLKNDADSWAQAGSITAALFLRRFTPTTGAWAHLDIFSWNPRARAGWPQGAEAQGLRALDRLLVRRYGAGPQG